MCVPGNVKRPKEELVISSPYTGKHRYMTNHVQSTLLPATAVPVLFLQHSRLCGMHRRARTVPQPQDRWGRGPFPGTKPLLRFQSHVMLRREEYGMCSDQLVLQREPTAFKKRHLSLPVL